MQSSPCRNFVVKWVGKWSKDNPLRCAAWSKTVKVCVTWEDICAFISSVHFCMLFAWMLPVRRQRVELNHRHGMANMEQCLCILILCPLLPPCLPRCCIYFAFPFQIHTRLNSELCNVTRAFTYTITFRSFHSSSYRMSFFSLPLPPLSSDLITGKIHTLYIPFYDDCLLRLVTRNSFPHKFLWHKEI